MTPTTPEQKEWFARGLLGARAEISALQVALERKAEQIGFGSETLRVFSDALRELGDRITSKRVS